MTSHSTWLARIHPSQAHTAMASYSVWLACPATTELHSSTNKSSRLYAPRATQRDACRAMWSTTGRAGNEHLGSMQSNVVHLIHRKDNGLPRLRARECCPLGSQEKMVHLGYMERYALHTGRQATSTCFTCRSFGGQARCVVGHNVRYGVI